MTCPRCTPDRLCLNHTMEARALARIRDLDHREAIALGARRWAENRKTENVSFQGRART